MSTPATPIETVRRRLDDRLAAAHGEDPEIAAEAAALRALLTLPRPADPPPPAPVRQPATAFLEAALAAGLSGPEVALATAIRAIAPDLAWSYGYPRDPARPDLGERIAFAQLLGEGGLGAAPQVLAGLTLIAPHTLYPWHAHPAIELYLVIAGRARWWAGTDGPRVHPPGSLVLHRSGLPHATQTGADPLLALYTWRGDLTSPSVFLPTAAPA